MHLIAPGSYSRASPWSIQGHLAYKKPHHPRTLQSAYAQGPVVVLGGGHFLMSEVPLYLTHKREFQ